MAKKALHERIGFDPEVLARTLLARLVAAGGVAPEDPRVVMWTAARPAKRDESAEQLRIRYLHWLGTDHLIQHNMQRGGPHCARLPCPVAGLSAAIVEIAAYLLEREDARGIIGLSDEIARFQDKPAMLYGVLLWYLAINRDTPAGLTPPSYGPRLVLGRIDALMEALTQLQDDLLVQLESPQFQQQATGRPAEQFLTQVCQQLHLTGGLDAPDIAAIILERPGLPARTADAATERALASKAKTVAKRLKKPEDLRSWHPYVLKGPGETTPP